jgi:thymidylate kinase
MSSKNIFISIDGVDGVGKTTVAKLLGADKQFQYHKSPAQPFAQLRTEIDTHATPLERYCFYRLSVQNDSTRVTELLQRGSVVCDRYIASTAAYHFALDPRIKMIHQEAQILKPDYAFLLTARTKVRDRRLRERAQMHGDLKLEQDSCFLDRVEVIFRSFGLIEIDTSDSSPDIVVEKITRIIRSGGDHVVKTTFLR